MTAPHLHQFRPLTTRARLVTASLGLYGVTLAVTMVNALRESALHQRVRDGEYVTDAEIDALYASIEPMYWPNLLAFLLSAVFFLAWLHRASRNASAVGVPPRRWGTGWAIGGFFVPVVNLWRPYQVITEIWRVSEPRRDGEDVDMPGLVPVPKVFPVWWAAWIIGNTLAFTATRLYLQAVDSSDIIRSVRLEAVVGCVDLVSIALVLTIVWTLTRRQEQRAASVGGNVPTARVV